jgi:hypothetical protein
MKHPSKRKYNKHCLLEWNTIEEAFKFYGFHPRLIYKKYGCIEFSIDEIPHLRIGAWAFLGHKTIYFAEWYAFIDKFKPGRCPYNWETLGDLLFDIKNMSEQIKENPENVWKVMSDLYEEYDEKQMKEYYFEIYEESCKNKFIPKKIQDALYNYISETSKQLENDPFVKCVYVTESYFFGYYKKVFIGIKDHEITQENFNAYCDELESRLNSEVDSIIESIPTTKYCAANGIEFVINGYEYVKTKYKRQLKHSLKRFDYNYGK